MTNITLRDVTESDLPILFEYQLDPLANQMAAMYPRDHDAFMEHWAKVLANEANIKKAIIVDDTVVGNISCFENDGRLNVGYWLGRDFWGKGIATAALATFLDQVTVRPLYAYVAKDNIASLRVLQKCGFTICGEDIGDCNGRGPMVEEWLLQLGADDRQEGRQ